MQAIMDGASRRDAELIRQQAVFNSFAWHKPDKIPEIEDKPVVQSQGRSEARNQAELIAAKAIMKAWAGRSKGAAHGT